MSLAITSGVAIGEGSKSAVEATNDEENGAYVFVDGVAVSIVC